MTIKGNAIAKYVSKYDNLFQKIVRIREFWIFKKIMEFEFSI